MYDALWRSDVRRYLESIYDRLLKAVIIFSPLTGDAFLLIAVVVHLAKD
jgi:hypothetical protein